MLKEINVALAQIDCKVGDKEHNLTVMERNSRQAKQENANLIIFPELALTGYMCRDLVYELAEPVPEGPSIRRLEEVTKKEDIHVIFGMLEQSEKARAALYNTAVLVGPNGFIGKYRKTHLPTHSVFEEKRYFRPGYQAPVFETNIGTLGLIICYDVFFPEITRLLRLKGSQLIICISASPAVRREFFETLTVARAIENTAYLVYVNLVGVEDGLQFWGGSRIVAPNGKLISQAKHDEEDLVIEKIDYTDLERTETFVPTLRDLRPELFDLLKEQAENL
ncbi:MAG: carbon-nitrogen hydrolase family protein [Candidatus Bathyarchaeota archaeon]|nr:MAG: carbon-nitrogen hydrolase family protein [Candidatus Bathyarchaeota archaeon]